MSRRTHPITDYRKAHGLTQLAFAKKIGTLRDSEEGARVTVGRWESGERTPGITMSRKISRVTGIPLLVLRPDLADVAREAAG